MKVRNAIWARSTIEIAYICRNNDQQYRVQPERISYKKAGRSKEKNKTDL
jgi:hypothetical protein